MNELKRYFERYALVSLEKQARLHRFLGDHSFELDLDAGVARFARDLAVPFQVLGTESENSLTWLWAWSDEHSEVPDDLLASARAMRSWGEKEGVVECTSPSFDLDRADGTLLSLIASEVCRASGYYRDHFEGGNLFLLLSGIALDERESFDRRGLERQLADLASQYNFDHRAALAAYFEAKGILHASSGNRITAELASGERVIAVFDEAGQVLTINNTPLADRPS